MNQCTKNHLQWVFCTHGNPLWNKEIKMKQKGILISQCKSFYYVRATESISSEKHLFNKLHNRWNVKVLVTELCLILGTPWTIACQAPLSMGFSRQEYWSELQCPPPGDLLEPGMESRSLALQADSLLSKPPKKTLGLLVMRQIQ